MANEYKINAAFVQQFHDTYELQCQQKESRLQKTVHNRGHIEGESFTINDMGSVEMRDLGAKFSNTVWDIPDAGVRTALMSDKSLFVPIWNADVPKLKASPDDKYMQLILAARHRKIDDIIYQAALAGIPRKTVDDTGVASTATVQLPSSQIIAASATAMTKAKLIKAKSLFRANECDEQNGESLYIVYNAAMLEQLLSDVTLTSADFMSVKMLQEGALAGKWLGFNWIGYEKLNNGAGGATERRSAIWTGTAVHFGDAPITEFGIGVREDKNRMKQIGGIHSFGAGRANEKKVVAIDFVI